MCSSCGTAGQLPHAMQVGWPARQPGKLETALANSFLVSSVVLRHVGADGAPADERLIGLARCTSDHVFNATIWDVLVDPEFQARPAQRMLPFIELPWYEISDVLMDPEFQARPTQGMLFWADTLV